MTKYATCGNCLFCEPVDDDVGRCKRYPPVIVTSLVVVETDGEGGRYSQTNALWNASQWPLVEGNEWCGEYEPAPKERAND